MIILSFKKNDKQIQSFTKKWVSRILWFGCIWITWSYVLASLDKMSIAETLSETVARVVIATVLGYLCKAFFETYSEKRNELKEKELELDQTINESHEDDYGDVNF